MTVQTQQRVQKAEADFDAVLLLRRSRKASRFDTIRFHCQQCAEKYLKARLQEAGHRFPKTHDLAALLSMLLTIEPAWQTMKPDLTALIDAAVEFRYPNNWASNTEAHEAYVIAFSLIRPWSSSSLYLLNSTVLRMPTPAFATKTMVAAAMKFNAANEIASFRIASC